MKEEIESIIKYLLFIAFILLILLSLLTLKTTDRLDELETRIEKLKEEQESTEQKVIYIYSESETLDSIPAEPTDDKIVIEVRKEFLDERKGDSN